MSKDRRGTGGGLTSEQFHDKFCDRTKDEDSLATKLAGWYWLLIFYILSTEAKKVLERDYLLLVISFYEYAIGSHSNCNLIPSKSNFMSMFIL